MDETTTIVEATHEQRTYTVCICTKDGTIWLAAKDNTRTQAENLVYTIKKTIHEKQFLDIHEPTTDTLLVSIPTREVHYVTIEQRTTR